MSVLSKPEMTYICTGLSTRYEKNFTSKPPKLSFGCLCFHGFSKTLRKEHEQGNSDKTGKNKVLKTEA